MSRNLCLITCGTWYDETSSKIWWHRLSMLGSIFSKIYRFLAFQIFQMKNKGRYWRLPPFETQLIRFPNIDELDQIRWTSKFLLIPWITFPTKEQPMKRWSTVLALDLQTLHLLGPHHPLLHRMSQVLIFRLQVSQIKHFSFLGMLKFQTFKKKLSSNPYGEGYITAQLFRLLKFK